MAVHLLPLLLVKLAGKLFVKKAAAHHGTHRALGRKVLKEAAKKGAETTVRRAMSGKSGTDSENR